MTGHPRAEVGRNRSVASVPERRAGRPPFAEGVVRAFLTLTAELAPTGFVSVRGEARNSMLQSAEPVDGSRQADDCGRVVI
jgi:hypothetical protein